MKKIFLFLFSVLAIASCSENAKNSKSSSLSETFKSDTLHLSIQYPKGWEILRNPNDVNSIAIAEKQLNANDNYKENIVFWTEEMPMKVSDSVYFNATVTQLKISKPDLNIQKGGKIKLGGNNFSTFSFDFVTNNSLQSTALAYCLVKDNRGYNFSCTAAKDSMPGHKKIFEEILASFKPL